MAPRSLRVNLRPEHLYKAVGLFFLFAILYRFFAELSRGILLLYAAGIVAVLMNAAVARLPLQRKWVTALLGLGIVSAGGVLLFFGIPALFGQLRNLVGRIPEFEGLLEQGEVWIQSNTGFGIELMGPEAETFIRGTFQGIADGDVIGRAQGLLEVIFVPLLILFGGLFATGSPNDRLLTPFLRAMPRDLRPSMRRVLELLGVRLMGWLRGTLISMLTVGVLSFFAYLLIGVPNALLLALIAGLTEFIPLLGPWIGGILAIGVAFLDTPEKALWTAMAALAIQQIESNLITPWAMSRAANVHPFVTLFALVFFGSLFGFLGIMLALPLVLLFWTLIEVLWVERTLDTDDDRITPLVEE